MKMKRFSGFAVLVLLVGLIISLGRVPEADAGIYYADGEVTYKEYWVNHNQFTGGCTPDGLPTNPLGSFYSEPEGLNKCPKTMSLTIPDNLTNALRAEIYVDMWRTDDRVSPRLRINNLPTVYQPPRGYDWSRTPWVIDVPLGSLMGGSSNTLLFWAEFNKYHIYDVAVRIYFDDTHPLLLPSGAPVSAVDGELVSISDDTLNVDIPADTGGRLSVNNDQLLLKANVGSGAKVVEFHAFYEGYDDDSDGVRHDWHNLNHNNWNPGGKSENPDKLGSTINHIGNVKAPSGGGQVSTQWKLPYIVNQSGVRFKIRIVDENGVVREAAGGVTPEYSLVRSYPVVYYTMPNFDDFGLHMGGSRPDAVSYTFPLPTDIDLSLYEKAYLLGAYWKKPQYSLNGSKPQSANPGDEVMLGVRELPNMSLLLPGDNTLNFVYGSGTGAAVEHPGPMIVLKGKYTATPELGPPTILGRSPAPNSTNVDIFSPVVVRVGDLGSGVDKNSIIMSVNNAPVAPVMSGPSNNLTLTYTPSGPYPTEKSIRVTVYACDLLGNCMTSADEYFFQTEPPDLTPPVISNVLVNSTNTSATVTWTTDEPATSKVEWGASTSYEKPLVSDSALVTQHSLPLAGLQPNTTYNFRLTSTDYFENTTVTSNFTFQTKRNPGAILSDEFAGCTLDTSVWSYINPANDAPLKMTGAGAQISVPAGTGHDLWKQGLKAPRLMQYVNNQNFDVEVKFDSTIGKNTQTMGILVQQDTSNWMRFNFQSNGPGVSSIVIVSSVKNDPVAVFTTPITVGEANYMRLNRAGDVWNLQYSIDGSNWIFVTTVTRTLTMSEIGPYVGNTGPNPAHVGVIDYFENLATPLAGDDTLPQLNVSKVGGGTVTRVPDKSNYECNETVQLTAVPDSEWEFGGWSGAINSTNPTTSILITQTANVVATFTNSTPYVVNVDVVSQGDGVGGTVAKAPNQTTYLYGDEVTLTATPTPGWSFVGWSGSFTGTDPVAVVPVTGDMNITATFDEDEYTLETMLLADGVGEGGTITVNPVQDTYEYGDEVTLTLTLNPGWSFVGWEGEGVSGTDLTLNLTMTQNVVAIAHIVQNQYDLDIELINNGDDDGLGNGVIRTPEQVTYGYGQMVTLTASPDLGWEFGGWGGALSGTELTRTLEITQDNAITATFNQIHYELNVTSTDDEKGTVTVEPQKDYYVYGDVVTLTPVPEKGYDFILWTGDKTGAENPLIFAITQNYTLEAIFDVDTTPIEILSHSIEVHGGTVAVVSWTTDVPGSSRVDYGETPGLYEEGTEEKAELVTTHKITLTGLTPETFYHYRIISVDEDGNDVTSEDLTFSTSAGSGLVSDDFSSCQLSDRWKWVDPLDDGNTAMVGTGASISVPAGTAHNIYTNGMDVPRLMQASNNTDFAIEVKFDSTLVDGGAMQGIVIEQDDKNFLRFNFYKRTGPDELLIHVYALANLAVKPINYNPTRLDDAPAPMYMRIIREGNKWTQLYSFDGLVWTPNVTFTHDMTVKQVGVFAGNTAYKGKTPAHTAVIDYFFNSASPIVPEDSFYKITTNGIEGSGKIALQPNKAGYYCGEEVKATATGSPGWSFLEWGGDLTGSLSPRTFTVTDHMNITARFQQGAATFRQFMPFANKP